MRIATAIARFSSGTISVGVRHGCKVVTDVVVRIQTETIGEGKREKVGGRELLVLVWEKRVTRRID